MPLAGTQIVGSQQNLGAAEPGLFAFRLVHRHQLALPQRGESLNFGEFARALPHLQDFHPGADCAGGDENDLFPRVANRFNLSDQNRQRIGIGQEACSGLDYDPVTVPDQFLSQLDIFRVHFLIPVD